MAEVIRMPKLSDTMTEGVIAAWLVKVGDKVKSGDILAEVETDKATMELENFSNGVVLYLAVEAKQAVAVDGIIAIVGKEGEDYQSLISGRTTPVQTVATPSQPIAQTPKTTDAQVFTMPKLSDTMTEGKIASWLVKVGDKVKPGQIIAEVETDKATMEVENYFNGQVLYLAVEAGGSVAVDGVMAIIGKEGTDFSSLLSGSSAFPASPTKPEPQPISQTPQVSQTSQVQSVPSSEQRIKASPLAKKIAKEKGIELRDIEGSGEAGRIVKKDVENFQPTKTAVFEKPQPVSTSMPSGTAFTDEPLSNMRKTIARRLSESKFSAPHFYLTMEINMGKAMKIREELNQYGSTKISFNDLVIKAASLALKQHPKVNASWMGDKIRYHHQVHIGVAVAIEDGLVVPVLRNADTKSLSAISAEVKLFGQKAKERKLQPADWEGSTFTISNLGMFGIEEFTAIINPPDSCIMAVGTIKQTAVVENNELKVGNVMKVTLSCDHRAVDGAVGAAFLQTFKQMLESPMMMLV
jgi:pyruvate dehydrogenase E2 component (dihydrolipoamide acetyltransferase)